MMQPVPVSSGVAVSRHRWLGRWPAATLARRLLHGGVPLGILLVSMMLLSACSSGGQSAKPTASLPELQTPTSPGARPDRRSAVKVALLLPLSAQGTAGAIAKAMQEASELALFEFDSPNVQLIVKDDKGTPEAARVAAEEAIKEGVELIIGPLFARSVRAAAPLARAAQVPVLSFSTDQSVAGNGVFLLGLLPGQDVGRIVSFAVAQGRRRIAALVPEDGYGRILEGVLRDAAARLGAQLVAVERYPLDANGMIAPTKRLREQLQASDVAGASADALYLAGGVETLPALAPLLPMASIDVSRVKLIGTAEWDDSSIGREAALLGAWYPAPDPHGWRELTQRFVKAHNYAPPRQASLAYDAISIAISLSQGAPGQRYTLANLTRAGGFAGIDGPFRLKSDGTSERSLAVLEVQKFGASVIDPAPNTFAPGPATTGGRPAARATPSPVSGPLPGPRLN